MSVSVFAPTYNLQSDRKMDVKSDQNRGQAKESHKADFHLPPYEYQALRNVRHIRRLILEPGKGDDPLVGHLEAVNLRDAWYSYPFEAISYVWGSNTMDQTITVDEKTMPITTALRKALCQTRFPDRQRALWADSICINQADNREKENQVRIMGQIYETSNCTLICLSTDSPQATDDDDDDDQVRQAALSVLQSCGLSLPGRAPRDHGGVLLLDKWRPSWLAILQSPWFRRGWVIQEAVLGPRCCLLWADVEIPWVEFLDVYRGYAFSRSMSSDSSLWEIPVTLSPLYYTVTTTLEMLHLIRRQDLTDPKDRIYASMMLPTSDEAMPAIQPDYSKKTSHLTVYHDFAVKYLEKNSDLDLLSFVEHPDDWSQDEGAAAAAAAADHSLQAFPSWVPRWDCGRDVQSWFALSTHQEFEQSHTTRHVSDGMLFTILDDTSTLRVHGMIFDCIRYVSDEMIRQNQDDATAVDQVRSIWKRIEEGQSSRCPGPHQNQLRSASSFLDVLGGGARPTGGDMAEWVEAQETFARLLLDQSEERAPNLIEQYENACRVSRFVTERAHNRRVVLLGRGSCGLAPRSTREGDACAVIAGTRLPLILRKIPGRSDDYYTVVGAAYIQTNGFSMPLDSGQSRRLGAGSEEFRDWNNLGLTFQDIFLC